MNFGVIFGNFQIKQSEECLISAFDYLFIVLLKVFFESFVLLLKKKVFVGNLQCDKISIENMQKHVGNKFKNLCKNKKNHV